MVEVTVKDGVELVVNISEFRIDQTQELDWVPELVTAFTNAHIRNEILQKADNAKLVKILEDSISAV